MAKALSGNPARILRTRAGSHQTLSVCSREPASDESLILGFAVLVHKDGRTTAVGRAEHDMPACARQGSVKHPNKRAVTTVVQNSNTFLLFNAFPKRSEAQCQDFTWDDTDRINT